MPSSENFNQYNMSYVVGFLTMKLCICSYLLKYDMKKLSLHVKRNLLVLDIITIRVNNRARLIIKTSFDRGKRVKLLNILRTKR